MAGRFCFHVNTYRCYIFGTQSFFMLLDIDDIYLAPALTLFHTKTLLIQNFTLRLTHSSFNPCIVSRHRSCCNARAPVEKRFDSFET